MGDWGFRISEKGAEVLTGDDKEMAFTSKYALFKGSTSGTGQTTVSSGNTNTVTIAHGLDYIPKVRAYADVAYSGFAELPVYGRITVLEDYQCWCYADATNIYLKFYYLDGEGGGNHTFNYKYFLYKDKGKL